MAWVHGCRPQTGKRIVDCEAVVGRATSLTAGAAGGVRRVRGQASAGSPSSTQVMRSETIRRTSATSNEVAQVCSQPVGRNYAAWPHRGSLAAHLARCLARPGLAAVRACGEAARHLGPEVKCKGVDEMSTAWPGGYATSYACWMLGDARRARHGNLISIHCYVGRQL